MMNSTKILIIEDDPDISEVLRLQLQLKNYTVYISNSYAEASQSWTKNKIDIFLIDRMLPDSRGSDICKELRDSSSYKHAPIILITAMAEPEHIIEGLDAGADDYITKPFDINILYARVRSQQRRVQARDNSGSNLVFGELELDISKCEVKVAKEVIGLTHTEFQILTMLAQSPGIVHSRKELIQKILGDDIHVTNRTIDTHIAGMRKKIGICSILIETIRGVGYRFRDND